MPQERCVPHAIAWRGHNPHQASPEHLVQSYPSLNAHTVGYGPFWENGIPEHLRAQFWAWHEESFCRICHADDAGVLRGPDPAAVLRLVPGSVGEAGQQAHALGANESPVL